MEFYERIKELTKKKGVTIDLMMKVCFGKDSSSSVYQGWQKRKIYPKADVAVAIADYLGVTVEYLVKGENARIVPQKESQSKLYADIERLVEKYRNL